MDRRDFLHPRQIAKAAGQVLAAREDLAPPAAAQASGEEIAFLRFARKAMATQFEVVLPFGVPEAMSLAELALDEIDRLESQLTVYHDSSEVSRLNREAFTRPVTVEDRLFGLLELAARLNRETGGAFDVTTGALTRVWGFYRRSGQVPSEMERAEVRKRIGMQHLVLDEQRRSVRFLRQGLEINLGSVGKGFALDRAADVLRRTGQVQAGLLHGGHSSVYAIGPLPGQDHGWPVGVRHPWDPERRLAVVRLRDRGLATSAATFQHLEYNGRKLGHILDPRSAWPAEGMASATVVAPTAAEADALSTAFFVLGVEGARAYCADHPEIGAVLLPAHENAELVILGLAPQNVDRSPPA